MRTVIYEVTSNASGLRYIGVTKVGLHTRWGQHVSDAFGNRSNSAIHAAIRKYGEHGFSVREIASIIDQNFWGEVEINLISDRKTKTPNGYNLTDGGEGAPGFVMSESTKDKIRAKHIGKTLSAGHRAKLSVAKKGKRVRRTAEHNHKISLSKIGHKHSPETLQKMSIAKKNRPWSPSRRACL